MFARVAVKRQFLALFAGFAMHHSIAGVYDSSRPVTLDGVIKEFRFVNPHPFVLIDAKDQIWKLEMDNLRELVAVGMTKDTLKPGDRIVVSGSPAREKSEQSLYVGRLDRPMDGFRYEQIGSSPRINFKPR
jgi:Family of unknown function (DUF6152)